MNYDELLKNNALEIYRSQRRAFRYEEEGRFRDRFRELMVLLELYKEADQILVDGFIAKAFEADLVLEVKTLNDESVNMIEQLLADCEGNAKA